MRGYERLREVPRDLRGFRNGVWVECVGSGVWSESAAAAARLGRVSPRGWIGASVRPLQTMRHDKKYRCGQHWYHQNCLTFKRLEHLRRQRVVKITRRTHLESQLCKWAQALLEVDSDEEE